MKRFTPLALLLACAASAVQAAGTMSASVSFTNLAFTVTDLRPADGVDPFFEILPSDDAKTRTSVYRNTPEFFDSNEALAFLGNASVSKTFADAATGSAKVTSTSVEAQAAGAANGSYFIKSNADLAGSVYSALIRITPGTRLTFAGNADIQTQANCGVDCYAQAVLELNFGYFGEENSSTKTLFSDVLSPNLSFKAPLGLSYANTSTEDQFLGLTVYADVEVGSSAATVPEPSTWALVLGGGLMALGVRRHRRPG